MHYSGTDGGNNVCRQFGDVCWLWQQLLQYSLSGKLLVSISLTHIFHNAPLERRCVTTVGKEHNLCTVYCKKAAVSIIFGLCIPAKSSSGPLAQLENKLPLATDGLSEPPHSVSVLVNQSIHSNNCCRRQNFSPHWVINVRHHFHNLKINTDEVTCRLAR